MMGKQARVFAVVLSVLVLMLSASVASAAELVFWNWPYDVEPMRSEFVPWVQENVKNHLPEGYELRDDYGPVTYDELRRLYILQARSGQPDVIEGLLENVVAYKRAGLIKPVTDLFAEWDESDQFLQSAIDALTIDGELWGVPYVVNVRPLLVRKSILEKHGLEPPTTWDELVEVAATISQKEPGMHGFSFTSQMGESRVFQEFMGFYFQLNKNMFVQAGDGWQVVATPEQLEQVLTLYHDLVKSGAVNANELGIGGAAQDQGYVEGKYAMVVAGPWMRGYGRDYPEVMADTIVVPLPVAEGGTPAAFMEVKPLMLNAFTKHPEAAWDLIKFLTSKDAIALENQIEGANPPRLDVAEMEEFKDDPWQSAFVSQLATGVVIDPINWELPIRDIIEAVQLVAYDEMSPSEAAAWLHSQLVMRAENGEI